MHLSAEAQKWQQEQEQRPLSQVERDICVTWVDARLAMQEFIRLIQNHTALYGGGCCSIAECRANGCVMARRGSTSCLRVGTRVIDALNGARDALNASSHAAMPALDLAIEVMAGYEVNIWSGGMRYERVDTSAALGRIRAMAERALTARTDG